MKKDYKILQPEMVPASTYKGPLPDEGQKRELELSPQMEKAMIAAGWIEGPIESKGGKA